MNESCEERRRRPLASRGTEIFNGCLFMFTPLCLALSLICWAVSTVLVIIFSMYLHETIPQQIAIAIIVMYAVAGLTSILLFLFSNWGINFRRAEEESDFEQQLQQKAKRVRWNKLYTPQSDRTRIRDEEDVVTPPPRVRVREGMSPLDQSTSNDILPSATIPSRPYSVTPLPQPSDEVRAEGLMNGGMRERIGTPAPHPENGNRGDVPGTEHYQSALTSAEALQSLIGEVSGQPPPGNREEIHQIPQQTSLDGPPNHANLLALPAVRTTRVMQQGGQPLGLRAEGRRGAESLGSTRPSPSPAPSPSRLVWP